MSTNVSICMGTHSRWETHPPFISWISSNNLKRAGTFYLHKSPFTIFTHRWHYQCSILTSSSLNWTKHMVENGRENQSPRRLLISILNLFSRSVLLCNSVLLQVSTMFLQRLYYSINPSQKKMRWSSEFKPSLLFLWHIC